MSTQVSVLCLRIYLFNDFYLLHLFTNMCILYILEWKITCMSFLCLNDIKSVKVMCCFKWRCLKIRWGWIVKYKSDLILEGNDYFREPYFGVNLVSLVQIIWSHLFFCNFFERLLFDVLFSLKYMLFFLLFTWVRELNQFYLYLEHK